MLGNLTVSSVLKSFVFDAVGVRRLRVVAEVDRAVGHRLVRDHPDLLFRMSDTCCSVRMWFSIAVELPDRHRCERGVLAVGGEDPRIVGIARTDPARAYGHGAERSRVLLALVGPAHLQVLRVQREVGQVLLAPVDRVLHLRVTGQRRACVWCASALPRRDLRGQLLRSGPAARCSTAAARRPCSGPTPPAPSQIVVEPLAGSWTV